MHIYIHTCNTQSRVKGRGVCTCVRMYGVPVQPVLVNFVVENDLSSLFKQKLH